jgi:hypothetical protein
MFSSAPPFGASGRAVEGSRHHFHLLIVTETTPLLYPSTYVMPQLEMERAFFR